MPNQLVVKKVWISAYMPLLRRHEMRPRGHAVGHGPGSAADRTGHVEVRHRRLERRIGGRALPADRSPGAGRLLVDHPHFPPLARQLQGAAEQQQGGVDVDVDTSSGDTQLATSAAQAQEGARAPVGPMASEAVPEPHLAGRSTVLAPRVPI